MDNKRPTVPIIYEGVYNKETDGNWWYGIVMRLSDQEVEVYALDGTRYVENINNVLPSGIMHFRE